MIKLFRALILVVGLVGATVSATPTQKCAYSNYRLPQHIVPRNYDILLDVNTERHSYSGSVEIELKIETNDNGEVNNNIIVLNVHPDVRVRDVIYYDVNIDSESNRSKNRINVEKTCRDDENELLVITLANDLADQSIGQLSVLFEAKIRDDDTGIYMSEYVTPAGLNSYHVSTDFQPNKARRAFPCFDEPLFKATFTIELSHDPARVALSNMGLLSEELRGDRKVSKFKTSPLMSMHMVAFAIGDFEYIEKTTDRGGPKIRAYTPVGKSHQAQFALDTTVNAFTYLEEYFDFPLRLEKIDMLTGVRHRYGVRGNWGLIVCNETLFFFDDENSSPIYRGYIAQTVVHGLSQQWFGNLVTLKWWNDLWLQAGFNTWVGYNVTNHLYPDLRWEQNYLIEIHQRALYLDSLANTHPIRIANVGKENIDSILNKVVHLKSTAMIKFLHDVYVDESETFRDGIRSYMESHKYGNAVASDLWSELQDASKFIESWIEQPGHPLVMVQGTNDQTKRLSLEQRRDGSADARVSGNEQFQPWITPVTIVVSDGHDQRETRKFVLYRYQQFVDLPDWFDIANADHWVKVNDGFRGFYHVYYSRDNLLSSLKTPILLKHLSENNRIGLLDDIMALYRSNLLTTTLPFTTILHWYIKETEGVVLGQYARAFSLIPSPSRIVNKRKRDLFLSAYEETPLSSEKLRNAGTRNGISAMDIRGLLAVYSGLLELRHMPLVNEALALFDAKENKEIAPIIRGLVYQVVAKYGSDAQIDKLQSSGLATDICSEEKNRLELAFAIVSERRAQQDTRDKRPRLA